MPKLSASGDLPTDAIIRVEVTAETINALNEDGSYKFNDDQLREWLCGLRGDREIAIAKSVAKKEAKATTTANTPGLTIDDLE